MLNEVNLIGRLGSEPELKQTPAGSVVVNVSIATTKKWTGKDGSKQEKTEWHRVVAWQKTAEIISEWAHKGDMIMVKGELETRSWDDKEGQKKYTTEINAHRVILLNTKEKPTVGEQNKMQSSEKILDKNYEVKADANFAADDLPF